MIYWLIIVIVLWIVSSYLYHTSTFDDTSTNTFEQYQRDLDDLEDLHEVTKPAEPFPYKDCTPNLTDLPLNKKLCSLVPKLNRLT